MSVERVHMSVYIITNHVNFLEQSSKLAVRVVIYFQSNRSEKIYFNRTQINALFAVIPCFQRILHKNDHERLVVTSECNAYDNLKISDIEFANRRLSNRVLTNPSIDNFCAMNKAVLLDGDFLTQLCGYLKQSDVEQTYYELQVLVTNRLAVHKTHLDFLRGGAEIIRTNTYRASISVLMDLLDITLLESTHLIIIAVQLARKAIDEYLKENNNPRNKQPLVAGTCGSYGVSNFEEIYNCPHYWDIMPEYALVSWHKRRIQVLLNAGVDMLAFESIPCEKEAKSLITLLQKYPQSRAWITFVCLENGKLLDGTNFLEVAVDFYNSLPGQVVAIGIYCDHPTFATSILRTIDNFAHPRTAIPLIVCSEKSITCNDNFECDNISDHIMEWLARGVRYIGGATNINAYDIKDLSKIINNFNNNRIAPNVLKCSLQDEKNTCISKM